ncbi:hypothetical protein GWO52_09735 [Corynebacterium macginleyi]|uniref:FAD/NAD(P)-binding protein n=1 Tax=Corynebacterium macginleyi TaxID=38290 RepID=UPI001909E177|nr:FAD/NAD(P)-binding protein [Corynebacterium macginleyi]MBK4138658.1 hypothetical protein [Corynebacterium macginleyi]MBK4160151.1 hypothetical protein [Corynebacterium macginleyi]
MTTRIAVIGAGVAAAAVARRVSSTFPHIELTIFDATPPQKHLAFGHVDKRLLCNTSTSVMSLDVEEPHDFAEFLGYNKQESSSVFSSRKSTDLTCNRLYPLRAAAAMTVFSTYSIRSFV